MSRYVVRTLGCKANSYDTQLIEQELQKKGWLPADPKSATQGLAEALSSEVELCIINSCTVTNEADRQSRKMATRLARENPNATIVMTGCGAEVDPEAMSQVKGVHFVVGNQNKNQLVDWVTEKSKKQVESSSGVQSSLTTHIHNREILGSVTNYGQLLSRHPHEREWPPASDSFFIPELVGAESQSSGLSHKTRCFLKIQEGCNSFCTYCIIPYGRGPSRSLPIADVVIQIQHLVSQGVKEVILTGTNIGDYGTDIGLGYALDQLIQAILKDTDLQRLRVSSLDPTEITPEIIKLMDENPRFCPHFHVSLQSPHSRILKLMKRKYQFENVKECLNRISEITAPLGGPFVGMDLITGFPGETDDEFKWTVDALESLPWSRLHVFPYSERGGTPATRLPGVVPPSTRISRARTLNELSFSRLKEVCTSIVQKQEMLDQILLEKAGTHSWTAGYTRNYLKILIPNSEKISRQNELISVIPIDISIDSSGWDVALIGKVQHSPRTLGQGRLNN